jgi:hypothetical protein
MILDSDTGNSIQILECELCGERSWDEELGRVRPPQWVASLFRFA